MQTNDPTRRVRFGPYEADFDTQELRKHGTRIRLSGQPLQVLEIMLAMRGQMVTRKVLQEKLWPGQVFGDSNHGLNAAVNKLREALSDSASEPKYIETLPRRGYRFIGSVETVAPTPGPVQEASAPIRQRVEDIAKPAPQALRSLGQVSLRGALGWFSLLAAAGAVFFGTIGLLVVVGRDSNLAIGLKKESGKFLREGIEEIRSETARPRTPANATEQLEKESAEEGMLKEQANRRLMVTNERDGAAPSLRPAMTVRRVIWGDGGNAAPQFSPDGRHIAFMSNRNGPWQIWVSEVDGSRARQVSFTESAGTPRWSPDGKSIAFDAPFEGSTWIFIVHVDRNERAQAIVEGLVPSFSRDGRWVYHASDRTGESEVWKTAVDGGSELQVTFNGGFAALESTDNYVYYSKSRYSEPEICRVPILGGTESCGFQHLRPRTWASWAVTREGVLFAEDLPGGQAALSLYDPSKKQVRDLVVLDSAPFWVGASIDGKKAIMNDAAERQISLVENLH